MKIFSRWQPLSLIAGAWALFTLGGLFIFPQAFAQAPGIVEGRVLGPADQPLVGINVRLSDTSYGAATDREGRYRIEGIPSGRYTLVASGVGYETETKSLHVEEGEVHRVDIILSEDTERLQEIVVSDRRDKYGADSVSSSLRLQASLLETPQNIQVITGDLIQDQQIFNMVEGIARNVSGVHREEH